MSASTPNYSDSDFSDNEVEEYSGQMHLESNISLTARRHLTRTDASSIVGGNSIHDVYPEGILDEIGDGDVTVDDVIHEIKTPVPTLVSSSKVESNDTMKVVPISDVDSIQPASEEISTEKKHPNEKPTYKQPKDEKYDSTASNATTQKVFSFSLPFGLSNIKANLYKQIKDFKDDIHFPLLSQSSSNDDDSVSHHNVNEQVRLRLERQESINTIMEAKYFKNIKSHDDARLRAMKKSISDGVSGIVHPSRKKEKENSYDQIFNELEGNVIVLGGYRGSILRDTKTKKRLWIPIKAGFNLIKINLLLGPSLDDEINATKFIYPDGMIKNIGPLDLSKKLIKKLSANPKLNVKDFGYDWRLSGEIVSRQLEQFMDDMYVATVNTPIIVLAHSMGGMMTHSVMQRRPELFRSIVYVGCPSECLNILGPIRFGDTVIFSDKILTPETNFMMRSGFNFLPLSGRVFVNRNTKEFYDLDYFNPDTWVEYNLNPLVSQKRKDREEERRRTLESMSQSDSVSTSNSSTVPFSGIERNSTSSPSTLVASPQAQNKLLVNSGKTESSFLSLPENISIPSINSISSKLRSCSPISIGRRGKNNSQISKSPKNSQSTLSVNSSLNNSAKASPVNNYFGVNSPGSIDAIKFDEDDEEERGYSISFTQAYEYLKHSLARAKEFVLSLEYKPELEDRYPPLVVVYGNQVPSVRGSNVDSIEDIKDGNYYNFYYGHGDGVIHQKWLMPQKKGFNFFDSETGNGQIVGKFASACGHVSLMTDIEVMAKALNAIVEAEAIWPDRKKNARLLKK
ncbi:uncharacterized protein CLIB1423_03S01882 [[Candida] railenensis]|uniref:Uncharacterized protein n=1 Tax=[Candida] railenensis TaxID=45579 RepID=A0A9P0VWU6_9ASCO|nr:uncharacterized protein CLIB1423_03S01882 [[Candida] railenensis]